MIKWVVLLVVILWGLLSCNKPAPAPIPQANFYAENSSCNAPCYVYFYNQSKNAISVEWRFGNGLFSNEDIDSTQYNAAGAYEVWLIAENTDGVRDSLRKTIWVN